jgi:ribosomal protein L12E/L44/L45/RPP1/RPP2
MGGVVGQQEVSPPAAQCCKLRREGEGEEEEEEEEEEETSEMGHSVSPPGVSLFLYPLQTGE